MDDVRSKYAAVTYTCAEAEVKEATAVYGDGSYEHQDCSGIEVVSAGRTTLMADSRALTVKNSLRIRLYS